MPNAEIRRSCRPAGRIGSKILQILSAFKKLPFISFIVLLCCSVCILLEHVMFTKLYIFEYKCNNVEEGNTVFWKFNFCGHQKLVVLGHRKWTRGNLWSKVLNQGRAYTPRECGKLSIIMFCKLLKSRSQYIGSAKLYLMFYFKFNSSKMEWGLTFAKIKRSNFCLPTWVECPVLLGCCIGSVS